MSDQLTGSVDESRPALPPPQRASGTIRRSDLRPRARRPTPLGWPLIVAGLVIGVLAVVWILGGRSSQQVVSGVGASRSPSASTAPTRATTASSSLPSAALPSPSSTPRPVRASFTSAPSIVQETPQPTQPPPSQSAGLTIVFPTDGAVLHDRQINVVGVGPPSATVTRDIPLWFDDHVTVHADGRWLMPVSLGLGENILRFRIGDDRSTEQVVNVTYAPGG